MIPVESKTPQGLPRVDWVQCELDYLRKDESGGEILLTLVGVLFGALFGGGIAGSLSKIPGGDFDPIGGLFGVVGGAFLGGLVVTMILAGAKDVQQGKRVRIPNTDYVIRPNRCYMQLHQSVTGYVLTFTGSNAAKEPVLFTARHNEILSFSIEAAEKWESSRKIEKPYEKLLMAQTDEGDTLTVARHYGSEAELNQLRILLKRNFIGWKPPLATESVARTQNYGTRVGMFTAARAADQAANMRPLGNPPGSPLPDDDVI